MYCRTIIWFVIVAFADWALIVGGGPHDDAERSDVLGMHAATGSVRPATAIAREENVFKARTDKLFNDETNKQEGGLIISPVLLNNFGRLSPQS
jgi:hypothetical protein